MVRIASSFFHHQRYDIDFSENMQFKLYFFFPVEKVYSYNKISVDALTPAGRLLVSNGLWRLKVCATVMLINIFSRELRDSTTRLSVVVVVTPGS